MKALSGLSINSKISLGVALVIMMTFFMVQTCIVFGLCEPSLELAKFGWGCVVFFMPPFFKVVQEFVSNIKRKEENIDVYLNAIDKSNLVVILNIDGYVLEANQNFCSVMGYQEKDLKNKLHKNLVPKEYNESKEYFNFWKTLKEGKSITGEFERIGKNGKSVWLFGNYTPIQNKAGKYTRVLKIATDITTQHEAEIIVNQKNTYLEYAAKIIRHDMHSGINTYLPRGIKSLNRRLSQENIKDLKISAPLKLISDGLDHTQKVYKGVYEFTNLVKENAQLTTEQNDVTEILKDYLRLTAYKNSVILSDDLPKTLEINRALFCTAVDNFIRNGLKYNDSGTKWVKIYLESKIINSKTKNFIVIEDNGRGITGEEFTKLSKPYIRKEDQSETGTGLGLNISIAILEEHGFKVHAEKKQKDNGTKIYIRL